MDEVKIKKAHKKLEKEKNSKTKKNKEVTTSVKSQETINKLKEKISKE